MLALTISGPLLGSVAARREALGERSVLARDYVPAWRRAEIGVVTVEVDSLEQAAVLLAEVDEAEGELVLDRAPTGRSSAIEVVLAPSVLALRSAADLYLWHRLGAAVFCLAYNLRNPYVDGVGEQRDGGLSHAGRELVRELERMEILIDVSHTSDAGVQDVLDATSGPVIATHSNSRSLCANPRNIGDEHALEIARRGGLVAPSVHPSLLAEDSPTIDNYVDQVCHFVEILGETAVALGADFVDFAASVMPQKLRAADPAGTIYRPNDLITDGLESFSDMVRLTDLLTARGLSSETIELVSARNYVALLGGAGHRVLSRRTS